MGARKDLEKPLPKAQALAEAKSWLRGLSTEEVQQLERGEVRPRKPAETPAAVRRFAHLYYWSGFVLTGDLD